jgi:hypothetical protein
MELLEKIRGQRVRYIVSSYGLAGSEAASFGVELERLLLVYPPEWVELALVETLVERWAHVSLERGVVFLEPVRDRLRFWAGNPRVTAIGPVQFQMIAGLDPTVVFEGVVWLSPEDAVGQFQGCELD